jgi:hypothetical protein
VANGRFEFWHFAAQTALHCQGSETGAIIAPMRKSATVAIAIIVLLLVTFAHPFEGNTYGFCPIFKSPLHAANDVVVAAIDITAGWLIYRGLRF